MAKKSPSLTMPEWLMTPEEKKAGKVQTTMSKPTDKWLQDPPNPIPPKVKLPYINPHPSIVETGNPNWKYEYPQGKPNVSPKINPIKVDSHTFDPNYTFKHLADNFKKPTVKAKTPPNPILEKTIENIKNPPSLFNPPKLLKPYDPNKPKVYNTDNMLPQPKGETLTWWDKAKTDKINAEKQRQQDLSDKYGGWFSEHLTKGINSFESSILSFFRYTQRQTASNDDRMFNSFNKQMKEINQKRGLPYKDYTSHELANTDKNPAMKWLTGVIEADEKDNKELDAYINSKNEGIVKKYGGKLVEFVPTLAALYLTKGLGELGAGGEIAGAGAKAVAGAETTEVVSNIGKVEKTAKAIKELLPFYVSSYGQSAREVELKGGTLNQQGNMGAVSGTLNLGTQLLLMPKWMQGMLKVGGTSLIERGINKSIGAFGTTVATYLMDIGKQTAGMTMMIPVENYAKQKIYDPKQKIWDTQAMKETGITTALLTAIMGGIGLPSEYKSNKLAYDIIKQTAKGIPVTEQQVNSEIEQFRKDQEIAQKSKEFMNAAKENVDDKAEQVSQVVQAVKNDSTKATVTPKKGNVWSETKQETGYVPPEKTKPTLPVKHDTVIPGNEIDTKQYGKATVISTNPEKGTVKLQTEDNRTVTLSRDSFNKTVIQPIKEQPVAPTQPLKSLKATPTTEAPVENKPIVQEKTAGELITLKNSADTLNADHNIMVNKATNVKGDLVYEVGGEIKGKSNILGKNGLGGVYNPANKTYRFAEDPSNDILDAVGKNKVTSNDRINPVDETVNAPTTQLENQDTTTTGIKDSTDVIPGEKPVSQEPIQEQNKVTSETVKVGDKVNLKGYGEVNVLDTEGQTVKLKNSNGAELRIGKGAFDKLIETPVQPQAKIENITQKEKAAESKPEVKVEEKKKIEPINKKDLAVKSLEKSLSKATGKDQSNTLEVSKKTSKSIEITNKIAKALGVDVVFVHSKGVDFFNGVYHDGKIFISDSAENPAHMVFGHELIHHIEATDPTLIKELDRIFKSELSKGKSAFYKKQMQESYAKAGLGTLTDEMFHSEALADLSSEMANNPDVMRRIYEDNPGIAKRLVDAITSFIAKFNSKNIQDDTVSSFVKDLKKVEDAYVKVMREHINKLKEDTPAENELSDNGIDVSSGSAAPPIYSLKTWEEAHKDEVIKDLIDMGFGDRQKVVGWLTSLDNVAKEISENATILDYKSNDIFSAVKPNSDGLYVVSVDFSTLCRKRYVLQATIEAIQQNSGKALLGNEILQVRDELSKAGYEVSCLPCYVEAQRLKQGKFINQFMNDVSGSITKLYQRKNYKQTPEQKAKILDLTGGLALKKLPKEVADRVRVMKKEFQGGYELNDRQKQVIEDAKKLDKKDFLSAEGQTWLAENHPDVYDALTTYVRERTKSKSMQSRTSYKQGEILDKVSKTLVQRLNDNAGLRWQSWSDFEVPHLIDGMQVIVDMARGGMKGHAYTKVADFIRAFGKTGMMINGSWIPKGSGLKNGELIFDEVEGMKVKELSDLRDLYPDTVGNIVIGVNDPHIRTLLNDPKIDYVIGYHISGLPKGLRDTYGLKEWKDYTGTQEETVINKELNKEKGGTTSFPVKAWWDFEPYRKDSNGNLILDENGNAIKKTPEEVTQNSILKYKELCADNGLQPKFNQFSSEPGYWKLLIDRKMINHLTGETIHQQVVQPEFDNGILTTMLDEYRKSNPKGTDIANYVANDIVDKFKSKAVETTPEPSPQAIETTPDPKFSLRKKEEPKETIKGYKLFEFRKGKLYPLFVDANEEVPTGTWLDATAGEMTDKGKVKSKLGGLAYRPGWHLGDLPYATHIGNKDADGNIAYTKPTHVWAECSVAADKNYQSEAEASGTNKKGIVIPKNSDLKYLPTDGFYRYKTNPNMTGNWIITGAMKVDKILTDTEVNDILKPHGLSMLPRVEVSKDLARIGYQPHEIPKANTDALFSIKRGQNPAFDKWFGDSKAVDDKNEPKIYYHGTSNGGFTEFNKDKIPDSGNYMGKGFYFTDKKSVGESYTTKGNGENPELLKTYLALKNPLNVDKKILPIAKQFIKYLATKGKKVSDGIPWWFTDEAQSMKNYPQKLASVVASQGEQEFQDFLKSKGYDGIEHIGGVNTGGAKHKVMIAFEPNQIKSATNNNGLFDPGNNDIRFSIKKGENKNFDRWFGESKAVDKEGEPIVLYHGTGEPFNIFDKAKRGDATAAESAQMGFFFSDSPVVAETYRTGEYDTKPIIKFMESLTPEQLMVISDASEHSTNYELYHWKDETKPDLKQVVEMVNDYDKMEGLYRFPDFVQEVNDRTMGQIQPELWKDVVKSMLDGHGSVIKTYLKIENPLIVSNELDPYYEEGFFKDNIQKAIDEGHDGVIFRQVDDSITPIHDKNGGPLADVYVVFEPNQIKSATSNRGTFDINSNNMNEMASEITTDRFKNRTTGKYEVPENDQHTFMIQTAEESDMGGNMREIANISGNSVVKKLIDNFMNEHESRIKNLQEATTPFKNNPKVLEKARQQILQDSVDSLRFSLKNSDPSADPIIDEMPPREGELSLGWIENSNLNAEVVPEEMKEIFRNNPEKWARDEVGNVATLERANAYVKNNFYEAVQFIRESKDLGGEFESAVAMAIGKKYQIDGNFVQNGAWQIELGIKALRSGRGIQILSAMKRFTADWTLKVAQREITNSRTDAQNTQVASVSDKGTRLLNEVTSNKDNINKLVDVLDQNKPEDIVARGKAEEQIKNETAAQRKKAKKQAEEDKKNGKLIPINRNNPVPEGTNIPTDRFNQAEHQANSDAQKLANKFGMTLEQGEKELNTVNDMVNTLYGIAKDKFPEKPGTPPRSPLELIKHAMENKDLYKETWAIAKNIVEQKYKDDPDALETLGSYFNEFVDKPFHPDLLDSAIRHEIIAKGIDIEKLIRSNDFKVNDTLENFTKSLVREGLSPDSAMQLSDYIHTRLKSIVSEKRQNALVRIMKPILKPKLDPLTREQKMSNVAQKITDLSNLKAFVDKNREFTEERVRQLVKQGVQHIGIDLGVVAREHYSVYHASEMHLVARLMEKGVNSEDAKYLADFITKEYGKIVNDKKLAIIQQMMKEKAPLQRVNKAYYQKIIEYSNLGLFSSPNYHGFVAKLLGLDALTPDVAREIVDMSNEIQSMPMTNKAEIRARNIKIGLMMNRIAQEVPVGVLQKVSTIQTMFQLLNPKTVGRNIISNAWFVTTDAITQSLTVPLDVLASRVTGKRSIGLMMPISFWKGFREGLKVGFEDAKLGINTHTEFGGTMMDLPKRTFKWENINNPIKRGAVRFINWGEKGMNMSLAGVDYAFKKGIYEESLAIQKKLANTEVATPEMMDGAIKLANYRTFNDDTTLSYLFSGMKQLLNSPRYFITKKGKPWQWGFGDLLIKYPRTPANLIMRGIDYSPLGFARTVMEISRPLLGKSSFDQQAFIMSIGRALAGTGSQVVVGAFLHKLGIITGQPSTNTTQIANEKMEGLGAYQFNVDALKRFVLSRFNPNSTARQKGDYLMSYDWFQPTAFGVSWGAHMDEHKGIMGKWSGILDAIQSGTDTIENQSLMQGINTAMRQRKLSAGAIALIQSVPSSFTPTLFNQVKQFISPQQYETYSHYWGNEAMNLAVNKVPWLAKNLLQRKINPFGEDQQIYQASNNPLVNAWNVFISPANVSRYNPRPELDLPNTVAKATGKLGVLPRVAAKSVTILNKTYALTPKEYHDYAQYLGQRTKEEYSNLVDAGYPPDDDTANMMIGILNQLNTEAKIWILEKRGVPEENLYESSGSSNPFEVK